VALANPAAAIRALLVAKSIAGAGAILGLGAPAIKAGLHNVLSIASYNAQIEYFSSSS